MSHFDVLFSKQNKCMFNDDMNLLTQWVVSHIMTHNTFNMEQN